ncbi:MAG: TetR/AcrR family transcriptional regulator [Chloroflexi bacterium]|nr:TetR/AcrR family transcriptional regulator [Chloroflexota bacterium]
MPKVSDAHVEARRQQILEAARACFARQGFHQTSIQDICGEAELSPGAVYRYFPSKEHIIAATCLDCQQAGIKMIESARSQGGTALQALDLIVEHGFGMLDQEESREFMMMSVQLWSEALRSSEVKDALLTGSYGIWVQGLTELLEQAQREGEVDPGLDATALARIIFGLWHGLLLHKSLDPDIDVKACAESFQALYHGTIRTPVQAE